MDRARGSSHTAQDSTDRGKGEADNAIVMGCGGLPFSPFTGRRGENPQTQSGTESSPISSS